MKDIIWLSPSLAAGAIAARLVVFFERRRQIRSRRGRGTCRGHDEALHDQRPGTRRDAQRGSRLLVSARGAALAENVGNPNPYNAHDFEQGCLDAFRAAGAGAALNTL
jgi:hypothetical protein